MKSYHIIGSGPTGMTIAWELLKRDDVSVTIYDKKPSAGGSWWEPSPYYRNLHSYRQVFKNCFINTNKLFKEMNIDWDLIFKKEDKSLYPYFIKTFSRLDYFSLIVLTVNVLSDPEKYKKISLKDSIGPLSKEGRIAISTLPINMDGIFWDRMSAYEFVKSFDYVALSGMSYTQRDSGFVMCSMMQHALEKAGAKFEFYKKLEDIEYGVDSFRAKFTDQTYIDDGELIICLDNGSAANFVKDNWGPNVKDQLLNTAYSAITLTYGFNCNVNLPVDVEICADTKWNILATVLPDKKTVCCVMCYLSDEILTTPPDKLKNEVFEQLKKYKLPKFKNVNICWGPSWNGERWNLGQTSGVLSLTGKQIPFYGKCNKVAMCGMMSYREVPFSSIEAAVEVGKLFCGSTIHRGMLLTEALLILFFILLIILFISFI